MPRLKLYSFTLADVDDPEIYAAGPLWDWQQTECGQWCMENCIQTPSFHIHTDLSSYCYRVTVTGELSETDHTYYQLKWG
jgi:hypothetical protein